MCDIQAAAPVNGIMSRQMSGWSTHTVNGGHEVTHFLGVCPDLSWHDRVEGMGGLSGAEGIHTPNSHRYAVGQAWDAAGEEREKHRYEQKTSIMYLEF